ncbi:MAG: helix-turn-helix domain-containing protein [Nitrosopumilaceae archaeon]|jgi:hypothetical protein
MIIRVQKNKNNPYVIINKNFLQNKNLSWKAKGLLSYLLSLPDNWEIKVEDLKNRSTDGRDSTNTIIKELITYGYIKRKPKPKEKGKFGGYDYMVYEEPLLETRNGLSVTENPKVVNNNNIVNNKEEINDSSESKTSSMNKITKYWNSLSHTRKHKESSKKTNQKINQLILDLKNGKFSNYFWDKEFLKTNKISKKYLSKKWTDQEIEKILKRVNNLYRSEYWPYDKTKLPRDLSTVFYNQSTGKSFFLLCLKNPPQLLNKEKRQKPKNVEMFNKFLELFPKTPPSKFVKIFNEYWERVEKIMNEIEPYYRHTSFGSYLGNIKHMHRFVDFHIAWIKKQSSIFPGLLKGCPWENFKDFVLSEHGYYLEPDSDIMKLIIRDWERSQRRSKRRKKNEYLEM